MRWVPPAVGVLKINVDGAFDHESGAAGVGVIIRDDQGQPLLTANRVLLHCRNAEEAEAAACLEGVRQAERWPDCPLILESDCATAIEKIKQDGRDRSPISFLIHDFKVETSRAL
ncbi:hypothetical protein PR202_ga19043 [Eleusine coracana subsp. coracana]|uniref:RNase H type-1 domain-containing protein n=1 Tax=Eleusine coracana subsp. coracana TaxID=191504 RepID=A0AAV5CV25_ELECO|nr:hypothetical protein PR202_ga19043 [Eleusine coracana subsp. coracana]